MEFGEGGSEAEVIEAPEVEQKEPTGARGKDESYEDFAKRLEAQVVKDDTIKAKLKEKEEALAERREKDAARRAAAKAAKAKEQEPPASTDEADQGEGDEPAKEPEKEVPAEKKKQEPKRQPEVVEGDEDDDEDLSDPERRKHAVKRLAEKARKLGYEVHDGDLRKVTNPEREKFREHMERDRSRMREEFEARTRDMETKAREYHTHFAKMRELEEAADARDHDRVAKALGYENWVALNKDFVDKMNSPAAREVARIKSEMEKERQMRLDMEKRQKAEEAERTRARLIEDHKREVSYALENHPTYRPWADDPMFINDIVKRQTAAYNPATRTTISLEEAAKQAHGAAQAVYEQLKKRFNSSLGRADSEAPTAGKAEKPHKRTFSTGGPGRAAADKWSKEERIAFFSKQMSTAAED